MPSIPFQRNPRVKTLFYNGPDWHFIVFYVSTGTRRVNQSTISE